MRLRFIDAVLALSAIAVVAALAEAWQVVVFVLVALLLVSLARYLDGWH